MKTVQGDVISGNINDVFTSASQDYPDRMPFLGQKVCFRDGSEYRFVSSAENVGAGQIVSQTAALTEYDGKLKAAAIGARVIALTAAGVTADAWEGGTLVIGDNAATGQVYKIVSNTATLTAAGDVGAIGDVEITLTAPLVVAIAATDDCTIIPFKWANVELGDATHNPVGVAVVASTGATSKCYFWVQVKGPGAVQVATAATATAGKAVMHTAAGKAVVATAGYKTLGTVLLVATADDDLAAVDLCIE